LGSLDSKRPLIHCKQYSTKFIQKVPYVWVFRYKNHKNFTMQGLWSI
jgi:hypothetical protein